MTTSPSDSPPRVIRAGRFSFREPLLLFPRLRLLPSRLELVAWSLRGRFRRQIPLDALLHVDVTGGGRLLLWLGSGEALRLRVDDAHAWQRAIDACLRTPPSPEHCSPTK